MALDMILRRDITIVIGYFNANVEKSKVAVVVGDFGMTTTIERRHRLMEFCEKQG